VGLLKWYSVFPLYGDVCDNSQSRRIDRIAVMMGDEAFRSDDGNRCPEVAGGEAVADGEHITAIGRGETVASILPSSLLLILFISICSSCVFTFLSFTLWLLYRGVG
jgi:hypothetical protein